MLTITKVHYIRELFFLEGKTISEISAMTEHNYRTIKKYIEMDDFSPNHHKAKRPNKSDVLRPIISQWLTEDKSRHHKQRHTAKRIYERLKEEHPDLLQVGARRVRDLVKEEKKKVFGQDEAYLRLHHPGGEAQVDFGSLEAFENGSLKKFHELIVSFPKSNAGFAVVTRSETREALMEGLVSIFKFIGYVPSSIWFDQMSTAALRSKDEKGLVKTADFFLRFATHYGFSVTFCNPNSGHEKGNVENKVGTIRRNLFVPEPTIINLDNFNKNLLEKCLIRNQEEHYLHKRPVEELFEEEKVRMIPFNPAPFDTSKYINRRVDKYGLVSFEESKYSASPKFIGIPVTLRVSANKITLLTRDFSKIISHHERLFTEGGESIHHIDFIDVVKVRPRALKYAGIYSLLPEVWQTYLASLDKDSYRQAFDALREILLEDDMEYAGRVLTETLQHETHSPKAISLTYKRLKENRMTYDGSIHFPSDLPLYEVDTSKYDRLMGDDFQ